MLDPVSNSLNSFMKEMYGDQFGEFGDLMVKDLQLFTNGVMIVSINVSMRFATWSSLLPVNVNYKMLLTV